MYISKEISEQMSEAAWQSYYMQELPRLRFFKPTEAFWGILKQVQETNGIEMFVDCGTGNGDLPKEARYERDIKMAGIDIARREGNEPTEVQMMPAHQMPATDTIWLMCCRPDHSGWARATLEKCLEAGSGFIYVGLRKNMAGDLGPHMMDRTFDTYNDMGEDGEQMLVFNPVEGYNSDPIARHLQEHVSEHDEDEGTHTWYCDCGHEIKFQQPELPQEDHNSEQNESKDCPECHDEMWFE